MNSTAITIYIIFIVFGIVLVSIITFAVRDTKSIIKQGKDHQRYIESIQIGDTFGHKSFKFSGVDDPFSENHNKFGLDPHYYVTIIDIKKNYKGETWVKYCFTRILNESHCEWTEEINGFLRYRTRISRRIDNINTREN